LVVIAGAAFGWGVGAAWAAGTRSCAAGAGTAWLAGVAGWTMLDGADTGAAGEEGESYKLGGGSAGPGRSSAALIAAGNAIRSNGNAKEICRTAGLSWKYMIAPRPISKAAPA
jgi:hypothetical protein